MVITSTNFARGSLVEKPLPVNFTPPSTDQYMSWSTSNNIFHNTFQPSKPAYDCYALMYIDESGAVRTETSHFLTKYERHIFPEEIKSYFADCSRGKVLTPTSYELSRKRSRMSESVGPKLEDCSWGFDDFGEDNHSKVPLRIGDTDKVRAFYEAQWRNFQQTNCRHMGKAYIKIIEPRKQVKFPYNGGKGAPGEKGDPEKTKPEWWPAGVIHREPDHLKKPDVAKLRDAGLDAIRQIKPSDRLNILDEIYRVRRLEELYEDGCIDGSTITMVSSLETSRTEKSDGSDVCGRLTDTSITPKIEADQDSASKYMRLSISNTETAMWPSSFTPMRNPSQASMSSTRSRPSFQVDFDSQVSSLPDDESETATPLDYGSVSIASGIEGHEMQSNLPRYGGWPSGSTSLHNPYFTTPDYSQSPAPIISQPLMMAGSYIPDLPVPPCQART
ncbi:hypothetical protein KEM54_002476 [Ascosphaera aggregata]|nr:hypothetical protein KEM54_002476 [Ascosphaera aggregata]